MGVYIFDTQSDWIKVGHFSQTRAKSNAYYRITGRGFGALKHPPELNDRLGVQHLTLLAWYPSLDMEVEKELHRSCPDRVGEFHPRSNLSSVLERCDSLADRKEVTDGERKRALEWGWRRVRAARRRARRVKRV